MLVDPIVSAVAGDSHKNAETRRALAPLVEFAERAKCALIGISHFTKGTLLRRRRLQQAVHVTFQGAAALTN
jgi:hypothetical protein